MLYYFKKENFNLWVICGSHPDYSVGPWVKWVNRCDPLSTLVTVGLAKVHTYNRN